MFARQLQRFKKLIQPRHLVHVEQKIHFRETAKSFSTTTTLTQQFMHPTITQGISGSVELMTGNFSYFTTLEAEAIQRSLARGKAFIIVFDRDTISVPANERAMWIREYFNHHPNLEVRVAYSPPPEKESEKNLYPAYIKKQLPSSITVKKVCCGYFYSSSLADYLQAEFDIANKDIILVEQQIKRDPSKHNGLLTPLAAKRMASFKDIIDTDDFKKSVASEKDIIKVDLIKLNPEHPNLKDFFRRTPWDLTALNSVNLPIRIGQIDAKDQYAFSERTKAQVFDMPIYIPGQGWKIPTEMSPYINVIAKITAAEALVNSNIDGCHAYITIDCGIVFPHGYARREGLHVDGFLTKANARPDKDGMVWGDNTYIVSDSKELQTEFYPGPFDLSKVDTNNPQAVLKALEIQGRTMPYQQFDPYDIVKLTTNNVHAVHPNLTNTYILRSFLKMTFSERLFNRSGNSINPNFHYRFMYVPREAGRNTQNYIGLPPVGFKDVDLREINFNSKIFPDWVDATFFTSTKKPNTYITANPAIEGEHLETIVDGDLITKNVARAGDMKVSRTESDSYFLGKNFFSLYKHVEKNLYCPVPRPLKTLLVTKNISFLANWGTRQNIPAGGYIVQDDQGDTWGVHKRSYEATYRKIK